MRIQTICTDQHNYMTQYFGLVGNKHKTHRTLVGPPGLDFTDRAARLTCFAMVNFRLSSDR